MRNSRRSTSLLALAMASTVMAGCASNSAKQIPPKPSCAAITSPVGCVDLRDSTVTGSVSTFGAVAVAPEVLAAEARSSAANEEVAKAIAARRPDAGFEASFGGETERNSAYSGQETGSAYSYALSLDIPLYQGGRTEAAIHAARADARASNLVTADRRISIAYELAVSLLRIRQQRELISALDRQRSLLGTLRKELRAELGAGTASQVDVDDTDRQIARIAVLRETAQLAIAEANRTADRLGVSNASQIPDLSRLQLGEDLPELINLAMQNNPRIHERSARSAAATARVSEAEGEMLPTVSARVQMRGENADLPGVDQVHSGRAEVRFSMPFDLSGGRSANVRQRVDEKRAAQFESEAASRGVASAVRSAFERRSQARRMQVLAQSEMKSAKAMLSGVRAERQVGERSTFDEIRAIENITNAEANLNAARFELQVAEYTLAAETGLIAKLLENSTQSAALAVK